MTNESLRALCLAARDAHPSKWDMRAQQARYSFEKAMSPTTTLGLLDRLAELEADAARYRWLRDNQQRIEIKRRKALMAIATGFTNYEYELFKTLDDAIDAAMKDAP